MMRALAYRGPRRLELEERPAPHARPGELVVHVDASAICGTDLRIAAGLHRAYAEPNGRVPGHELAGTIAEVGSGVRMTEGARVFVAPNYGCGRCPACRRGAVNLCETPRALGITDDGAFAEYARLPHQLVEQGNVMEIDAPLDPAAIALAEPLACVLRGSRACRIAANDLVLVFGAGPIGLLHVAVARLAAAQVVVCEPDEGRRLRALHWGADAVHADPSELDEAPAAVIVAAPAARAQQQALEVAAPGARINFFAGLPRGSSLIELDTNLVHYKELLVTGTTANTNADCHEALALILDGRIDTAALIDARFDLTAANDAFELAASGRALKVVIEP
jgi:L-iditol 2-dehydrogenase